MKVGILTLPLHTNYGGILQAYALQKVIEQLGHDAQLIVKPFYLEAPSYKTILKRIIQKYIFQKQIIVYAEKEANLRNAERDSKNENLQKELTPFINKNIRQKIISSFRELSSSDFDAIVVGSDQCWRPVYVDDIKHYFLDFTKGWNVKRLSYAASFGVDNWEYSQSMTKQCRKLIRKFDGISVREKSAVSLCQSFLGVTATQVLDPTLLLSKEKYLDLIKCVDCEESDGDRSLFCYILDMNRDSSRFISTIEGQTNLKAFHVIPQYSVTGDGVSSERVVLPYPSIESWLKSFLNAKLILTDSFHGMIFSIIFNKPFWVLGNNKRGLSRQLSLLETFGLTDRMIRLNHIHAVDWMSPIDWNLVNDLLYEYKNQSKVFLRDNLL